MDNDNKKEIDIQKNIAYTAGLLQGDITIKRLIESIAEGVVIINEHGRIVLVNTRFAEMSGYSKMEVMGKDLNIFINPYKHKVHKKHLESFFASPRIRPMGAGLELTVHRKDKTTFPVEISISFLDTESGRIGIAFITDNTERKKALDALTRRNMELDAYAHTVAHDLKSALTGISGFSDILIDENLKLGQDERREYIKIIAEDSKKMDTIIKELLLFASIDKIDIELKKFSMKEVIDGACSRLKFQIDQVAANISIKNIIDCTSYPAWVEEVWYNYLSNALKYGGDKPEIIISSAKTKDGYIKYSVTDNGPGISAELKETLFEESGTSKIDPAKGTGLGLSIVKRIIGKLDGYVSVDSNLGKGSEFSFYLKE